MDNALKFDKVAALPHDQYNRVPADLLDPAPREVARPAARPSPKFQEEEGYIAKAAERKAKHQISLNEAKFRAETHGRRRRPTTPSPRPRRTRRAVPQAGLAWESNYYNDEVLAIVTDYLTLGSRVLAAEPVRATVNAAERPPLRP